MVIIRPLLHQDFRTSLPPIQDAVQWSTDNQVAVITRQGIVIFELTADPGSDSDDAFFIARTNLSTPQVAPKVDVGWPPNVIFTSSTKPQVLELLLDRVLTPRGLGGVEFDIYFLRVDWSRHPVDSAFPYYKPKCLLGALTSTHQLKIYDALERQQQQQQINALPVSTAPLNEANDGQRDDDGDVDEEMESTVTDEWVSILDISAEYHKVVRSQWSNKEPFDFKLYKERLYQVAIVDFGWIEPWEEGNRRSSNLVTFHGNGDVVFWRMSIGEDCRARADVLSSQGLIGDSVACRHKYAKLSSDLGVLAVAFTSGVVQLSLLHRPKDKPEGFEVKAMESIWEEDKVAVEFIQFTNSRKTTDGVTTLCAIVVKHPNVIISFNIRIERDGRLGWEEVSMLESPDGHIVGFAPDTQHHRFVLKHENGAMSYVHLEEGGVIEYESDIGVIIELEKGVDEEEQQSEQHGDYADSHKIHSSLYPVYASLWAYYGFALSPNAALGCSLKALRHTHDAIVLKEASACTFVSLFPQEDGFESVREMYRKRGGRIQAVLDALHGFRYQLRMKKDYNFRAYFNNDATQMDMEELKLYIWVLRCMGLPKRWTVPKSFSMDDIEQITLDVLRATTLAQERLLQLRFTRLVERISGVKDELGQPINAAAWNAIVKYLLSKPNHAPALPGKKLIEQAEKSVCSSCDMEIDYKFNKSYDPATQTTHPGIPGYPWAGQTCLHQHKNPLCILSLLPLDYPHRLCPNCGAAALVQPAFNQAPECPFCEEYMKFEPEKTLET